MKTLKKISPLEFRLHTKKFVMDYSPLNYLEKLRFTVLFSRLLFWFFRRYGLYLFSYKLRLLDTSFIFQFFYYKTRQLKKYLKSIWWRKISRVIVRIRRVVKRRTKKKRKKRRLRIRYKKWWKFLTKSFWRIHFVKRHLVRKKKIISKKRLVIAKEKRRCVKSKFYRLRSNVIFMFHWQRRRYRKYRILKVRQVFKIKKRHQKYWIRRKRINFNFFFIYFFFFYFKVRAFILYKSLYKYFLSSRLFRYEHKFILRRLGYIKQHTWAFDFLFFSHISINFANFDFVLPFFVYQIKRSYKQRPFLNILLNFIKFMYYFKTNIFGIKVIVHGPYDRHGRSRTLLYRLGTVSLTSYKTFVVYDTVQWPTFYGATQIKLWILYSVPLYNK